MATRKQLLIVTQKYGATVTETETHPDGYYKTFEIIAPDGMQWVDTGETMVFNYAPNQGEKASEIYQEAINRIEQTGIEELVKL